MKTHLLHRAANSVVITLCGALYLGTAGCGDDDDTGTGGGGSANTGTGQGGAGTQAGAGGTVSGGAGRPSVTCGDKQCTVIPEGEPFIDPCCLKDNTCGAAYKNDSECQAKNQEGSIDPRCPSHTVPSYNNMKMPGCCKSNGKCGVSSTIGFGCVERTQLAAYAGGPLPARDCDATDEDAGN
jgi:hypothetical protein